MDKHLAPWGVTKLLNYRGSALIGSTAITAPIALAGFWVLASWANDVRHNEDTQMIILGCALPFAALCLITNLLVHRRIYRGHTPSNLIIRTGLLELVLAWPIMVLSVILTASLPLPMIDQRTPTITTLWIILVFGWCLLTFVCAASVLIGVHHDRRPGLTARRLLD